MIVTESWINIIIKNIVMDNQDFLSKMIAQSGMKLLNTTATSTFPSWGLVVREDTVIAVWTDQNDVDLVQAFEVASQTLTSVDPVLTVPNNKRTKTLKLTSGSVWQLK